MKRLLLLSVLCLPLAAQTAINDTLYLQGATPWTGQIVVSWPAFTSCAGTPIARGSRVSPVNAGVVAISLWATDCAAPSFAYAATYRTMGGANHGQTWTETWVVPSSPSVVTLATVRQTSTLTAKPLAHASTHASGGSDPLTKAQIGLGNVDNTADANKPVSAAQQAALDLKANAANPTFTGNVSMSGTVLVGASALAGTPTQNRDALQAILTANAGKQIILPDGVFLIAPVTDKTKFLSLPAGTHLSGRATLAVPDGAAPYDAVLYSADCTGCTIEGITIDANVANNAYANLAEAQAHPRIEIRIDSGSDAWVDGVTVKNSSAVDSISTFSSRIKVTGCSFLNMGDDPNHVAHDTSTIYVFADGATISGNHFVGASIGAAAAVTAVEIHGANYSVSDNRVENYETFANITGIQTVENGAISVVGNTGTGLLNGIYVWSGTYGSHITGNGINGLTITGNSFRFNQLSYAGKPVWGSNSSTAGIAFYPVVNLSAKNVTIANNVLVWDFETVSSPGSSSSVAIGIMGSGTISTITGVSVVGNIIENAPIAGIKFYSAAAGFYDIRIVHNLLRNTASSVDVGVAAGYKIPLAITGSILVGVEITGNQITDDLATTRMTYGMTATSSTTSSGVRILDNSVTATGTTKTAFVAALALWDNTTQPFIRMEIPGFTPFTSTAAAGSAVTDSANGWIYTLAASGTAWSKTKPGLPALVGTVTATAQAANLGSTALYVVPSNGAGVYRVSCHTVITQAATSTSTLPNCYASWADGDTSVGKTLPLTAAPTTNTVGTNGLQAAVYNGVATITVAASTTVNVSASTYASSGATPMQYTLRAKLEYLGP